MAIESLDFGLSPAETLRLYSFNSSFQDLIGTDSARFNIRQDFNDTRIKMMEETEAKLEQKSEEQKKRKEARDTQELTEMVNIMESKIENEWALAKKIEEDGDKVRCLDAVDVL